MLKLEFKIDFNGGNTTIDLSTVNEAYSFEWLNSWVGGIVNSFTKKC
ncbi:hypothetical protein ADIARSV_1545 [Arcticibacter svalbardensis MN12-7]|uniref:Uncharacterized protein n=1 Tax=Arcticibacter svalbardensis MN12-7 TaxID=1150600 RepID=R9GUC0_9SPHI|nr:hypothetical protein ADIARSV_1545 [Arcticibacter svalbardensis MN12-7]